MPRAPRASVTAPAVSSGRIPPAGAVALPPGAWAPALWWMGCHGGAGASTLARLTGFGRDAGGRWPVPPPGWPTAPVLLVCRSHARGLWAATGVVEQWARGQVPPGTRLLGLVVVAASERSDSGRAADRLRVLRGWLPQLQTVDGHRPALWRIGWVQTLLAVDDPLDVGIPPDVDALRHALARLLRVPSPTERTA